MTFFAIDPVSGEEVEVGGRVVMCSTVGCFNEGAPMEVPDSGWPVSCGPCGEWIIPPVEPEDEEVEAPDA